MSEVSKPHISRVIVTTPRGGPLEPLLCHFDSRLTMQEAATAAALVLGYVPSRFTFASDGVAERYEAKVRSGSYELVEVGGVV